MVSYTITVVGAFSTMGAVQLTVHNVAPKSLDFIQDGGADGVGFLTSFGGDAVNEKVETAGVLVTIINAAS